MNGFAGLQCQDCQDAASDYLDGHISAEQHETFRLHAARCPACQVFLEDIEAVIQILGKLRLEGPSHEAEAGILRAFEDEVASEARSGDPGKKERALWQELQGMRRSQQAASIALAARFRSRSLCTWLVSESRRVCQAKPALALELAEAAILVCSQLPGGLERSDLLAQSWSAKAGSYLGLSDFAGASRVLRVAERHYAQSGFDELTKARLLMVQANLSSTLGRPDKAATKYGECLRIFEAQGERLAAISMLVNIGSAHLRAGKLCEALRVLRQASVETDDNDPPRVEFATLLNLAIAHCELGNAEEAERLMPRLFELGSELGREREVDLKWLLGSIARAKEDWSGALKTFEEVRSLFMQRGEWLHYIESSLDIAKLHLMRSDWAAISALVAETRSTASSLGAEPECLRALILLEDAVAQRALGEAKLRALSALLAGRSAGLGVSF